jgi:hypothetical protein
MKPRSLAALFGLALLVQFAALLAIAAATGHADPDLANVRPTATGSTLCGWARTSATTPGNAGIQQAFNQFHNNLHIATASSIGPAAPGLRNGIAPDIEATPCSVTTPPD